MSPAELGTYLGEELGFNIHQIYALVGHFVLQLRLRVPVDAAVRARLHRGGIKLHDAMARAAAAPDGLQLGDHLGAAWGSAHSAGCSPPDAGNWIDRGRAGALAQPRWAKALGGRNQPRAVKVENGRKQPRAVKVENGRKIPREAKARGGRTAALALAAKRAAERGEEFVPAEKYDLTLEDLQPFFTMKRSTKDAAAALKVSRRHIYNCCRKLGIRWGGGPRPPPV